MINLVLQFVSIVIQMPFYRNLGAIRFEGQTSHFEIFRAQPEATIFQSKIENTEFDLESLADFYQSYLKSDNVQFYNQNNKNSAILVNQGKPMPTGKISIDDFCQALLEATKMVTQLSLLFSKQIGGFSKSYYRAINGKLVYFYLPIAPINEETKIEGELVKGILSLGQKLKEQSNMSHKLLLKKLAKCKTLLQVSQQITYFYSVYGVSTKSAKQPFETKQSHKRQNKRKINIFKMVNVPKPKLSEGLLSSYSRSMHSSAPKRNTSFNIGIPDKRSKMAKTVSNSCSSRTSPYNKMKFKTIDFNNPSFHQPQQRKVESPKIKKNLKRSKINACETFNTQVSIIDEQKLLKKLNKKKPEATLKKVETISSFKQIENSLKSQISMVAIPRQSHNSTKNLQQSPKKIAQSNPVSVKLPANIEQSLKIIPQTRQESSKTIHKHQSIHISHTHISSIPQAMPIQVPAPPPQTQMQGSQKKLKKKPIKQQQWGSEIEIVDLTSQQKNVQPPSNSKMNGTKQFNSPKMVQQTKNKQLEDGVQTRKNSWNPRKPLEETTKTNNQRLKQLLQKKNTLDYMGQTVINTPGYLKNYESIFWQLPLFFIYRSFYIERIKLAKELQKLHKVQGIKDLIDQNQQIGVAVNKMAKMITKRLKKDDPNALKNIRQYLNTEQSVNCDAPMKGLLGQYIQSLNDASAEYHELLQHYIEIVDSYLIAKGHSIIQKDKLQTHPERQAYLKGQLQKLKPYL